jgi:hypothetical protein
VTAAWHSIEGQHVPITLREKIDSRASETGQNPSVTLLFLLEGTSDDLSAKTLAWNSTPTMYDGLVRQSLGIEPEWVDTNALDGRWLVTVRYGSSTEDPPTGDSTFSFDTGGGTQHITQSLQTIAKYPAGSAPDFKGAIGVTHDNVEGVDITVPVYQFSETHYLADAVVTPAYRGTLFQITGKVNSGSFRGLAPGECLFLGASGSKRGQGDWEITFRFAGSPNVTGLTVGPIGGINKKGWEYMWVRYADSEDDDAKVLVKKPVAVYIEKVYESASFAGLGIGS